MATAPAMKVGPMDRGVRSAAAGRRSVPTALIGAWGAWAILVFGLIIWLEATSADSQRHRLGGGAQAVSNLVAPPDAGRMPLERPVPAAGAEHAKPVTLARAPDPGLVETTEAGPLPRIDAAGRKPWQVYARPFDAPLDVPRVAVVVTGLGLNQSVTDALVQRLPPEVSLAFSVYADQLAAQIAIARLSGHEVLVMAAMEPNDFPNNDPGPRTLLTSLDGPANVQRLDGVLAQAPGAIGVVADQGAHFETSVRYLMPVLTELGRRGLMFVDNRADPQAVATRLARDIAVPRAYATRVIENDPPAAVDAKLADTLAAARGGSSAVVMVTARPQTLDRLDAWFQLIPKAHAVLAPVSAVANLQPEP